MTFKIEDDIPVPSLIGIGRTKIYPFDIMKVGESFLTTTVTRSALTAAISYWSKKTGFKFVSRVVDGGIRVWRYE